MKYQTEFLCTHCKEDYTQRLPHGYFCPSCGEGHSVPITQERGKMIETIAELIEVLEKYPGHFKVKLDIIEGYDTISNVEEDDKDRPIVYIQN